MWAFLAAIIVVAGLSYGAAVGLETLQRSADSVSVGSGARPDPDPRLHDGQQHAPKS